MLLPTTVLYGTLLTALFCALGIRAALGRMLRVEEAAVHRWVRAHGNLAENAPLFVIGLGLVEAAGGSAWGLHACGVSFVVARVSHAWALSRSYGPSHGRRLGIIATWTLLGVVWCWALWLSLMGTPTA